MDDRQGRSSPSHLDLLEEDPSYLHLLEKGLVDHLDATIVKDNLDAVVQDDTYPDLQQREEDDLSQKHIRLEQLSTRNTGKLR